MHEVRFLEDTTGDAADAAVTLPRRRATGSTVDLVKINLHLHDNSARPRRSTRGLKMAADGSILSGNILGSSKFPKSWQTFLIPCYRNGELQFLAVPSIDPEAARPNFRVVSSGHEDFRDASRSSGYRTRRSRQGSRRLRRGAMQFSKEEPATSLRSRD